MVFLADWVLFDSPGWPGLRGGPGWLDDMWQSWLTWCYNYDRPCWLGTTSWLTVCYMVFLADWLLYDVLGWMGATWPSRLNACYTTFLVDWVSYDFGAWLCVIWPLWRTVAYDFLGWLGACYATFLVAWMLYDLPGLLSTMRERELVLKYKTMAKQKSAMSTEDELWQKLTVGVRRIKSIKQSIKKKKKKCKRTNLEQRKRLAWTFVLLNHFLFGLDPVGSCSLQGNAPSFKFLDTRVGVVLILTIGFDHYFRMLSFAWSFSFPVVDLKF